MCKAGSRSWSCRLSAGPEEMNDKLEVVRWYEADLCSGVVFRSQFLGRSDTAALSSTSSELAELKTVVPPAVVGRRFPITC